MFLSALDQTISENAAISRRNWKLTSGNTVTTAIPAIAEQFESPTTYTWIGSSLVPPTYGIWIRMVLEKPEVDARVLVFSRSELGLPSAFKVSYY